MTNLISQIIVEKHGGCILDRNNLLWKFINNEWVGKRSVWTYDFRCCWLEDTTIDNIKSWWCGINSDYKEIFKK